MTLLDSELVPTAMPAPLYSISITQVTLQLRALTLLDDLTSKTLLKICIIMEGVCFLASKISLK